MPAYMGFIALLKVLNKCASHVSEKHSGMWLRLKASQVLWLNDKPYTTTMLMSDALCLVFVKHHQSNRYCPRKVMVYSEQLCMKVSVLLPAQPAPPATGCAVAGLDLLQPESQEYTGSFGSLPALCGSLWSESETVLSSPVSVGLSSVRGG